ncbi:hypothetical protein LTSEGIV_3172 [Salmonella enterica subsp. enterica serovar Give str. S5-487]|nr:hypothetical protein LTSEGIV_3172 [Salmonella enterica subsp. enterica serovar Give str. S5-487]
MLEARDIVAFLESLIDDIVAFLESLTGVYTPYQPEYAQ